MKKCVISVEGYIGGYFFLVPKMRTLVLVQNNMVPGLVMVPSICLAIDAEEQSDLPCTAVIV